LLLRRLWHFILAFLGRFNRGSVIHDSVIGFFISIYHKSGIRQDFPFPITTISKDEGSFLPPVAQDLGRF